jgi:gamma-glutamylcyclotransferase (GGCT)/AIG2-like uncharacterized protein YtfP
MAVAGRVMPLFVYGTLRRGSHHPNARRLAREAAWLGPARAAGKLWRIATYPGFDPRGREMVRGDLYRLRSVASLRWLDAYEMCGPDDPRPHPYARRRIVVRWRGRRTAATTYVWVASRRGLRTVRRGDWFARQ